MAEKDSASLSGDLLARKGAASADGFTLADAAVTRTSIESSYRWRLVIISATIAASFAAVTFVGAALFYGERWVPAVHTERMVAIPPTAPYEETPSEAIPAPADPSPDEPRDSGAEPKPVAESLLAAAMEDPERARKAPPSEVFAGIHAAAEPAKPVLTTAPPTESPKPLATAVASDVSKQHAAKIATETKEAPAAKAVSKISPSANKPETPERLLANADPKHLPAAKVPPHPRKRPPYVPRTAYRVQLHALGSDAAVRREWRRLKKRHRTLFSGLKLKVSPKRTGPSEKTVYRMQLGALPSRGKARALCKELQRRKMNCIVVRERS